MSFDSFASASFNISTPAIELNFNLISDGGHDDHIKLMESIDFELHFNQLKREFPSTFVDCNLNHHHISDPLKVKSFQKE